MEEDQILLTADQATNIVDLAKLSSPSREVYYHNQPDDYFHPGVDRMGKYDTFWKPGINQEAHRANNQSWFQTMGNGLLRSTLSIGTKTLAGLGHVFGAGKSLFTGDPTDIYTNAFADFWANEETKLKDALPVYKSLDYQHGNLGDKFWTAEFWADNFLDGVAFAASAALTSKGMGLLGKTGMFSGLTKLAKTQEVANKIKAYGQMGATAAVNTVSEAGVEARELYKQLIADGVDKEKAQAAALETFNLNMAVLTVPNLLQAKWIQGPIKKNFTRLKELAKTQEGLKYSYKDWMKAVGEGFLSEGLWEENVQTAIERYETDFAKGVTDEENLSSISKEMITNAKGFIKFLNPLQTTKAHSAEDEGATSILLGGLIGGPMSIKSSWDQFRADRKEYDRLNQWYKDVEEVKGNVTNGLYEDLGAPYKQFDEEYEEKDEETGETVKKTRKTYRDQNGNLVEDFTKKGRAAAHFVSRVQQDAQAAYATLKGDEMHHTWNKELSAAAAGYRLATSEHIDPKDIDDVLDLMAPELVDLQEQFEVDGLKSKIKGYFEKYNDVASKMSTVYELDNKDTTEDLIHEVKKITYNMERKLEGMKELQKLAPDNEYIREQVEELTRILKDTYKNKESIIGELVQSFRDAEEYAEKHKQSKEWISKDLFKGARLAAMDGHKQLTTGIGSPTDQMARLNLRQTKATYSVREKVVNDNLRQLIEDDAPTKDIIEYIQSNLDRADMELAKKELDKTGKRISQIQKRQDSLEKEIEALDEEYTKAINNDEQEKAKALGEQLDKLEADLERAEFDYTAAERNRKTLNNLAYKSGELVKKARKEREEVENRSVERMFLEDVWLPDAMTQLAAFKEKGEDFDPAPSLVAKSMEKIRLAMEVYKEEADNGRKEAETYYNLLGKYLEKLEDAYVAAQANYNNKIKDNKEAEEDKTKWHTEIIKSEPIYSILSRVLPPELIDEILSYEVDSLKGGKYEGPMAKIFTLVDKYNSMATKADKVELEKAFEEYLKGKNKIVMDEMGKTDTINRGSYDKSPHLWFEDNVITAYSNQNNLNFNYDPDSPFFKYIKKKSLSKLQRQFAEETKLQSPHKEKLGNILNAHIDFVEARTLRAMFTADKSMYEIIDVLQGENEDVTPSLQQFLTTVEALSALLRTPGNPTKIDYDSKTKKYKAIYDKEGLDNTVYISGPAGSGKTHVVARGVLRLYMSLKGIKREEVLAFSDTEGASENIQKSLKTQGGVTANSFLMKAQEYLEKTKLIVIDEAAAFETDFLEAIMTQINEYNKKAKVKDKVHVVTLGDASQVTAENTPLALHSGYMVSPLTIAYRTSIGAIEEAASYYKDNPNPVEKVLATTNVTLAEATGTDATLTGVLAGKEGTTSETITKILAKRKNDDRRRVILVANAEAKLKYKNVTNAEVKTYKEFNGQQADEVYLDIEKTDQDHAGEAFSGRPDVFGNPTWIDYNSTIYTAISRGIQFVYIGNSEVKSTASPQVIDASSSTSDEIKAQNDELFADMINSIKEMFGEFLKGKRFKKPVTQKDKEEAEEEEATNATPEEQEQEEPTTGEETTQEESPGTAPTLEQDTPPGSKSRFADKVMRNGKTTIIAHQLAHINHNSLPKDDNGEEVEPDSNQFTAYNVETREGYMTIIASRQYNPEEGRVMWRTIAVLGAADMEGAFGEFYTKVNTGEPSFQNPSKAFFDLPKTAVPLFSGTISEKQKIAAKYNPQKQVGGMNRIAQIIARVVDDLFNKTQLVQQPTKAAYIPVNGSVRLEDLKDDVTLKIMRPSDYEKPGSEFYEDHRRVGFKSNVPYLILENLKSDQQTKDTPKRFFVRMSNMPWNINSPGYTDLKQTADALAAIEEHFNQKFGPGHSYTTDSKVLTALVEAFSEQYSNESEDLHDITRTVNIKPNVIISQAQKIWQDKRRGSYSKEYAAITPEDLKAIDAHLETLVKMLYKGVYEQVSMTRAEYEVSDYKDGDHKFVPNTRGKRGKVYRLGLEEDGSSTGIPVREKRLRRRGGLAQKAFDTLARQNAHVIINGKKKRIRAGGYDTAINDLTGEKYDKKVKRGLSILTALTFDPIEVSDARLRDKYEATYGPSASKGKKAKQMAADLIADEEAQFTEADFKELMADSYKNALNLQDLQFVTDNMNEEGVHQVTKEDGDIFYLRQDINGPSFNSRGEDIASNLNSLAGRTDEGNPQGEVRSSFVEFLPTKVEITVETEEEIEAKSTVRKTRAKQIQKKVQKATKEVEEIATPEEAQEIRQKVIDDIGPVEPDVIEEITDEEIKDALEKKVKKADTVNKKINAKELDIKIRGIIEDLEPSRALEEEKRYLEYLEMIKNESPEEKKQSLQDYFDSLHEYIEMNVGQGNLDRLGREITKKEAVKKIRQLLPGVPRTDATFQFLEREAYFEMLGKQDEGSWGVFKNGIMYFRLNQDGNVYENTVSHEVFHRVWQKHLTPEQRTKYQKLAITQFDKAVEQLTEREFEEYMAQLYEAWRTDKIQVFKGRILNFFKWTRKITNHFIKEPETVKELFDFISKGHFNDLTITNGDTFTMEMNLKPYKGSIEVYKQAVSILKHRF
jgi:hypothetical protein